MFKITHHALVLLATAALMPLSLAAGFDETENSTASVPTQKTSPQKLKLSPDFLSTLNSTLQKAPEKKDKVKEDTTPELNHLTQKRPKGPQNRRPQSKTAREKALKATEKQAAEETGSSADSK
ncbi:MAG: hypothetical protein ACPG7U_01345 [Holosporaceae bacterium]